MPKRRVPKVHLDVTAVRSFRRGGGDSLCRAMRCEGGTRPISKFAEVTCERCRTIYDATPATLRVAAA